MLFGYHAGYGTVDLSSTDSTSQIETNHLPPTLTVTDDDIVWSVGKAHGAFTLKRALPSGETVWNPELAQVLEAEHVERCAGHARAFE
jgi:hypothetical protein